MSALGILVASVIVYVLLALVPAGIVPLETKGGLIMLCTSFSVVIAGFISNYIVGLALLPTTA